MSVAVEHCSQNSSKGYNPVVAVPWFSADQFKKVYHYLYSEEIVKKKWAYDTIALWETRCHPSLPTAIEATYVLVSAVIQDILWNNSASLIHHTDLQSIYGSAITRFVSLTVEVNKRKDWPLQPTSAIAKSIGIPSFIIDLRNEVCHANRPTLMQLRKATQAALIYLKDSYWEKEASRVHNSEKFLPNDKELRFLFEQYTNFFYNKFDPARYQKIRGNNKSVPDDIRMVILQLERYIAKDPRHFIRILVSEDIFIPLEEHLLILVSPEEFSLFRVDCKVDDFSEEEEYIPSDEYMKRVLPELPTRHENMWAAVIASLNKYDSVPLFMEFLLKSQGDRTVIGQKLIVAWILKILRISHSTYRLVEKSRSLKRVFRRKGIFVDWQRMFYSAVINPCKYTPIIIPLILNNLNLKKEVALRVINTMAIYLRLYKDEDSETGKKKYYTKFHTVDDLKFVLVHQRMQRSEKLIYGPLPRIQDDCHKIWPQGAIINMIDDDENGEQSEEEFVFNFAEQSDVVLRILPCNENDNEDDDTAHTNEPDLDIIKEEMRNRKTFIYKK